MNTRSLSIRTISEALSQQPQAKSAKLWTRIRGRRLFAAATHPRKRTIRAAILLANIVVLAVVVIFVLQTSSGNTVAKADVVANNSASDATVNPLDQVSSADIAAHVADLTQLPEANAVANQADTENTLLSVAPADNQVIAKPQVINTTTKTRQDIQQYTAVAGDTVPALAAKFGVTSNSIRWSNNLTNDVIPAGTKLWISPISDGIVYVVKSGDTAQSIASKYHADQNALITFNDAEVSGFSPGEQIVIPSGSISTGGGVAAATAANFDWNGAAAIYGSNGYDFGYCTWYVANLRAAAGHAVPSNLGNASSWYGRAIQLGLSVGASPQAGAVIWTPADPSRSQGHVGYVQSVNPDGSVVVTEMNVVGFDRVSSRVLSPDQAASYRYIY